MTSSNGNIFRFTGPLCGEFTGEFPSPRPVTLSFDVFFDLRLHKPLSKQSWGWWFETPSRLLWHHCVVDTSSLELAGMSSLELTKPRQLIYIYIFMASHMYIICNMEKVYWANSCNSYDCLLLYAARSHWWVFVWQKLISLTFVVLYSF